VHAHREPARVVVGDLLRGRAVDHDAVAVEVVVEEARQRLEIGRLDARGLGHEHARGAVEAVVREAHEVALERGRHLEVQPEVVEHLALAGELIGVDDPPRVAQLRDELGADDAGGADDGDRELGVGEGERRVRRAQRLRAVLLLHDDRDLSLGRALRNDADVDARVRHRLGEGGAGARAESHALADDGHD